MAAPKLTQGQREALLRELAERYCRGVTQADMMREFGLTKQMVSYYLKKMRAQWRAEMLRNVDERISEELAKIDHLERTYWEAWESSLANSESSTVYLEKGTDGRPAIAREALHKVPGAPDYRALEGVRWCVTMRMQLLGLQAPQRLDVTSAGKELAAQVVLYLPHNGREAVAGIVPESELGEEAHDQAAAGAADRVS